MIPPSHTPISSSDQPGPHNKKGGKLLFWLTLSCLSVIFAEVSCFSSPFPFTTGWGLLVVLPLYGLHSLVLGSLVFKAKKIDLRIFFLAGMLFGLYEALITKVMWNPTWGDKVPVILGFAATQTAVLMLFWHPWFAFILPMFVAERYFTSSSEIQTVLPIFLQRALNSKYSVLLGVLLAFFLGVYQANSTSAGVTALSTLEALAVFLLLKFAWKKHTHENLHPLRELLPTGKEFVICAIALGIFYVVSFFLIRFEAVPRELLPHITLLILYAIIITTLVFNIKKSAEKPPAFPQLFSGAWLTNSLIFAVTFVMSSLLFIQIKPEAQVIVLISWVVGVIAGVFIFITAILRIFQRTNRST